MTPDDDLLADALDLPVAERGAWLGRVCGDAAQRTRLEALLRGYDKAQLVLRSPLVSRPPVAGQEAGTFIGRYKLLEKIGEGGCGVVWMAEQTEPVRRRVALKIIKLGMDTREVIARFEAERQALALMEHPHIAKVLDAGATETGRPYFVMELVRGIPITRHCDEHQLTAAQRLELFIQVCHAIQHAHQKGIIHRDIKPSNILVTLHDDVAVPKVIDFGIAKATQGRLTDATVFTAFEQFIGTPAYMSPEQAEYNALDVDTRSDVYSLGVLLYELLTGRPPFDPKTLVAGGLEHIRHTIREVDPPRPSTRLSTLSDAERTTLARQRGTASARLSLLLHGDLDWIVMKALEKNRTRRYESASAFAGDVQRFLGHEPVAARPPSRAYLLEKLVRRHRFAFAAAAVVAVVLALGATVSTWQAVRATRAEREQSRLRATESALRREAEAQALTARRRSYASDLNLVQQALAVDNLGRAQELLNRQRPQVGERDLRGWEWRYLWQFCRSESAAVLNDRPLLAPSLAVSADGHWLAIARLDPVAVELWNLRTREQFQAPLPAGAVMASLAFSPTEPVLAIGVVAPGAPPNARVILWDAAARRVVREWPVARAATQLRFAADGKSLLTTLGADVVVWPVADGEPVSRLRKRTDAGVALSPDFSLAAIESADATVRVVEFATGRERWTAKVATEHIAALAFSPDGKTLATAAGGADTAIRLWDAATGAALGALEGHRAFVRQLVFWPDGRTLASGGQDQTIRIWDLATRRLTRTLHGHQSALLGLALLPDRTTLVSAAGDGTVRFWDTTAARVSGARVALASNVLRWRFSADSQSILSVDAAGQVRRWHGRDFAERDELASIGRPFTGTIPPEAATVEFAVDRPLVAIAKEKGVVQIWNWERAVMEREIVTPAGRALPVAFLKGGEKLLLNYASAAATVGGRGLYEWDLTTGAQTRAWPRAALRAEYVVAPDGRSVLVRPFDQPTGFPTEGPLVRPATGTRSLIDLGTGAERPLAGVAAGDMAAIFSPDGRFLAAPVVNSTTVWDTANFQPVQTLTGSVLGMQSTAFSPDGRRLIVGAGGVDAIRVWDTESWEQLLTLAAPRSLFTAAAFSPDGHVLGATTIFGELHLWRAPAWAEIETAEKK